MTNTAVNVTPARLTNRATRGAMVASASSFAPRPASGDRWDRVSSSTRPSGPSNTRSVLVGKVDCGPESFDLSLSDSSGGAR